MFTISPYTYQAGTNSNISAVIVPILLPQSKTAPPERELLASVDISRSITASPENRTVSTVAWGEFADQLFHLNRLREQGRTDGDGVTRRALSRAITLLKAVQEAGFLLSGDLYPDCDGGLRVEWEKGEKQLVLSLHANLPREDYLFWQIGTQRYDVEAPLSEELFLYRLRWLQVS